MKCQRFGAVGLENLEINFVLVCKCNKTRKISLSMCVCVIFLSHMNPFCFFIYVSLDSICLQLETAIKQVYLTGWPTVGQWTEAVSTTTALQGALPASLESGGDLGKYSRQVHICIMCQSWESDEGPRPLATLEEILLPMWFSASRPHSNHRWLVLDMAALAGWWMQSACSGLARFLFVLGVTLLTVKWDRPQQGLFQRVSSQARSMRAPEMWVHVIFSSSCIVLHLHSLKYCYSFL